MALLITNIEFKNKDMNRDGADKDEDNMEDLLIDLGYEVVKYTNRTGQVPLIKKTHFLMLVCK